MVARKCIDTGTVNKKMVWVDPQWAIIKCHHWFTIMTSTHSHSVGSGSDARSIHQGTYN